MKKCSALTLLMTLALHVIAQLPPGSTAPDFTAEDINGKTWHLYDLLEQGKVVVMEVSATWCAPCWSYHNSQALEEFYKAHGPSGDGTVQVLYIEGDPATNTNCLYGQSGCNDMTPGNWVAGTTYPILDNADIADAFMAEFYPSIFLICPNKKVYEIGPLSTVGLQQAVQTCPVAFGSNNAGIFNYKTGSDLYEICEQLKVAPSFSLINLGTNALTGATVDLKWNNNTLQSVQWTGNLPRYGEAKIQFDSVFLHQAGTLATTVSINNGPDEDAGNNTRSGSFVLASAFNSQKVLLKIRTDQYGAETYWELRDATGKVLDSGGNANVGPNGGGTFPTGVTGGSSGTYGNNVIIKDTLLLPAPGCYSIHFVDAYGDGICCTFGNGYYKLYNLDNPLSSIMTGGPFKLYDHRGFGAEKAISAAVENTLEPDFEVYPNPADAVLHIDFELREKAPVAALVSNALGQTVYLFPAATLAAGLQQWNLPVENWPDGLYLLHLRAGAQTAVRRFVVQAH